MNIRGFFQRKWLVVSAVVVAGIVAIGLSAAAIAAVTVAFISSTGANRVATDPVTTAPTISSPETKTSAAASATALPTFHTPTASPTTTEPSSTAAEVTASPSTATATTKSSVQPTAAAPPPSSKLESDVFNGCTIQLPAGSKKTSSTTGEWGEVRKNYKTPDGEKITTIAFSADFGWSEYSQETTDKNPDALESAQTEIDWNEAYPGGYTSWTDLAGGKSMVTFVTFDDSNAAAVVQHGAKTPAPWLLRAIEKANCTN